MKAEPFQITAEEKYGESILYVKGELDLSVVPQLQAALENVMYREDTALVLNLRDLTYIDSTGIGIVVTILKARDALKAPFYVREIPPSIRRLFDLTGITRFLKEGTEADA
ncbi:STAS domain-containing protein [Paenibacillus sp. HB172176]|uniref:STAS domain-containing protein n=1 Tax=Paenibacillus sp. HB172176 TaxID=2493690 RepID=UPI0014395436|nr:STAS domain-containing protein [Paenibacillus sp. HB172176]